MFYSTNLSKEASTLTKWLVSIPSVAHAKGPSLINQAIYEGLREFPYFKNHQNHLTLIAHDDGSYSQADLARPHSKSSVVALVKSLEEVSDTLVLLCDTDTSSPYHYGMFKGSSTSCDDLALKLRQLAEQGALSSKIEHLLKNDNALFGLGILESKCATGAMIAVLKELSDNYVHLNLNILFVCTCESSLQHRGIKQCIPFINKLCEDENLKLRLAVNAKPNTPTSRSDRNLHLYSGSYGKIEPSFYIIGHSATAFRPYEGFSASIIASELIRELELNPKLTQRLHHKPLVPTFDSLRVKEFGKDFSPDGMQVSFSLPLLDIDLGDLLEVLKEVAATAIEHAAELVDHRESSYAQIMHEDFIPEAKDAEVISFSDLVERTRHNFSGNLDKALSSMVQKCRHEGLSLHQASITIIERLNEIAHLPRPSIVIYYTDNYVPPMSLATNDNSDRELLRLLNGVIVKMRDQGPLVPTLAPYYAPTDGNFLRPEGHDAAFDILNEECPVRAQELNTLQVPTITLGIQGDDLTLLTEHVTRDMCSYVPSFLLTLVDLLAQPENALGLEYHDDLQRHLDALGRKAETIASASVREIQTINQQNASTGFYAQVNQGTLTPHSLSTFLHQFQQNNQAGGAPALEHKAPLGLPLNPDSAAASAAATSAEFAPDTELAPSSELMTKQLTVAPKTADTQEAEEPAEPQEPQSTAPDNKADKGNKAVRAVKSLFKKAQEAKQALEDNIQANSVEQSADAPISLVASHHYKGKSQPETAAPAVPSAIDVALEAASAIAQMVNQDQPNTATAQPEFAPDADADAELTIIPVASVANLPPATVSAAAEQPTPSTEPAATDSARTNNAAQPAAAQTAEPKSKKAKGKKKKKAAKHAQERAVAENTSAQGKIDLAAQAAEVKTEGSLEITNATAVPSADKAEAKIELPKDTKQDKTAQSEARVEAKIEAPEGSVGKAEASLETTQVPAADSGAAEQDKATELETKTEPEVSVGKAEATLETTQVSEADSGAAEQDKATELETKAEPKVSEGEDKFTLETTQVAEAAPSAVERDKAAELETKAEPEKVSASAAKATLETTQDPAADSDAAKQDKAAELETKAESEKVSESAAKATLETTQVAEAAPSAVEQDKATELETKAEPEKVSASAAEATLETTQDPAADSDAAEQDKATELETKAEPEKVSASAAEATLETTQVAEAAPSAVEQDKATELETKAEPKVSEGEDKFTLETTQVAEAAPSAVEQDKAAEPETKAEPEKVSASAAKATLETTQVPAAVSDAAEQNKATAPTKPAVAPSGFFAQALAATSAPVVEQAEDKAQTAAKEAESSTQPAATCPALAPEAESPAEAQAEVTEAKTEASADAAAGSESKREGSDLGSDLKSAVDTAVDSIESALSSSLSKVSSFFKGKSKLKSSLAKLQEQVKETIEQEKPKAEHHILTSPEPELNLEQVTNLKPLPEPDTKRADDQAYVPVLPTLPEFKGESAPRPEAEPQAPAAVEATAAAAAPAASAAPEVDESLERELEALVQTQSEDATDAVIAALHQDDAAAKTIEVAVPQAPLFDLEQLTTAQVPAPEPAPEPVPKPKAEPEQTATEVTEASSGNTIITRRTLVKPSATVFISAQEHRAAAQPAERKEQPKEPTQDQPQDQSKPQAKAPEVNADMVAQLMAEAVSKKFKEHKLAQIDPLRSYSENQEPFADAIYANDINVDLPSSQMFDPTSDTALEADALSQEIQSKTGPLQTTPKSVAEVPPRLEVQPEPAAQPANTPSRELQTPQTVAKPQAQGFAPDADAMLQPLTAAAAPSAPLNQLFAQAQKELQGSAVARHLRAAHEPFAPDAPESAPAHYEFAPDRPAAPNAEPSADDLIAAQGQAQVEQVAAEPVTSKAKTKLTAALDAELAPAADEGPTLKRYDPAQAYAELLLDDDEQYRQHAAQTIDQKAQAKAQQAQAKQQALDAATATALGDMLNDDFSAALEAPRTSPTQRAARPSGQSLSERRAALRRAMYGDEVESAPVSKPTERRGSYIDLNQQGKVVSYNPAELTQTLGAHTQSTPTSGVVGAAHAGPVGSIYDSMVQGTVQGAAATAPRTSSYRPSAPAYGTPSRTMQAPPPAAGRDSGNGLGHAAGNAASSAAGNSRPVSSVNYGSSRMSTTRSTMNPSVQRPTTTRTTPHSSHRFSPNSRLGILDDEPMVGNSGRSLRRANTTLNSSKPATTSSADSTSRTTTTKRAEPVRSTTRAATTSRTPSRSTGTKVETLASSNPGVRILRTTTTQPAAPVKPVRPRNEVVYSQGGAVVISQRITADQASSLLNQHHESKESHEPTAPTAIEGSTAELRRSAEQSLNTSFKRLQEDKSISGTIVIRSDQNKRPR